MFTMSWSTFRERWQLFVGSVLTVSVGVALVQASLLTLLAAVAPATPPGLSAAEEVALDDRLAAAGSLLGMIAGISVFVAFFVVGSTFSFTVAQRCRDFGLLRLVGASSRQVRRLLLGEAMLLGTAGTIFGVLLGVPVARLMTSMLIRMDFVPARFDVGWRPWILAVSATVGIGVAVVGSLAASRRASRVRPLEALRDTGRADRVMTVSRWVVGLITLAGATALMVATPAAGGDPLGPALPGLIVAIVALSALSPLAVPVVGRLVGLISKAFLPRSPIRELVDANVRDGVRRSASTAAPIVVLVGLVVGFSGVINVVSAGSQEEARIILDGDLVVESMEPVGARLAAVDGVRVVSEEVPLRVRVDSEASISRFEVKAVAISPKTYQQTHRLHDIVGNLSGLQGDTVALDRSYASDLHVGVGDLVQLRLEGVETEMRIVATFPYSLSGSPVLLPIALAPTGDAQRRYIVQTETPAAAAGVTDHIETTFADPSSGSDPSTVSVVATDDWIQDSLDNQQRVTQNALLAVLGLVTIYLVIAMINAVVIGAAARRAEFASDRLTGLTRGQVVQMALWESLTVVTVGVILGAIAAAGATIATTAAVSNIVGTRVVAAPWSILGAAFVSALVVVGLAAVMTTLTATRQPPAVVAGATE